MRVLITERISDNRFKDGNGYLIISNNVIARTGKQIYKHGQVYDNSDDMYTDVEVDRPANEVFATETIASFENKPVTIMHPEVKVNSYNHNEHAKGFFREIRRGRAINPETGVEEDVLMGTAVITHQQAIDDIESGRWTHWSCGYDTEIVQSENPYQTKIRGNHIALTSSPRAGKIAAISDEENQTHIPHFIQVLTDALDVEDDIYSDGERIGKQITRIVEQHLKGKSTFQVNPERLKQDLLRIKGSRTVPKTYTRNRDDFNIQLEVWIDSNTYISAEIGGYDLGDEFKKYWNIGLYDTPRARSAMNGKRVAKISEYRESTK